MNEATHQMKTEVDCSVSSVTSGSELFLRFITLQSNKLEEGVSGNLPFLESNLYDDVTDGELKWFLEDRCLVMLLQENHF